MRKKTVLMVLVILAALALVGFIGYKVFMVRAVRVEGNVDIEADEIISLSAIGTDINIFSVDLEAVKENIETSPFLECIGVAREYPDTIAIQVKERRRRAMIQYLDAYLIIDEEGYILQTGNELMKNSFPIVTGVNVTSFQIGSKLQATDSYQITVLEDLLVELQEQQLDNISEVDVSNPVGITLLCRNGMKVYLGDASNVENRLQRMTAILKELEKEGIQTGTLDVSGERGGTYLP